MNIKDYKKILNQYKDALKEYETKVSISLFSYEKFYNDKLDELYNHIISLKKSRQIKDSEVLNLEKNNELKEKLFKDSIENEIVKNNIFQDNEYNTFVEKAKISTKKIFDNYESNVNSFSLTYENTIERLDKSINDLEENFDKNNQDEINELIEQIKLETLKRDKLFQDLNNVKKSNKNIYIQKNTSINNQIRLNRKNFLKKEDSEVDRIRKLIITSDELIENAKHEFANQNKKFLVEFNDKLNEIDAIYGNQENTNSKYSLEKLNEKTIAEINKDKLTDEAKINQNYKINFERNKSSNLRSELDFSKKKLNINEKAININFEQALEKIEIEKNYDDEINENSINLDISLLSNDIDTLKKKKELLVYKNNQNKSFNIQKLVQRKKEISVINMLKCENQKILRDSLIDIEYLKLDIKKQEIILNKKLYENSKYLELLDFCNMVNIKNYQYQDYYYKEVASIDKLVLFCEKNIEDTKIKYTYYQQNNFINQKISSLTSEKIFVIDFINLVKRDYVYEKKALKLLKKSLKLFFFKQYLDDYNFESQKALHKNKYNLDIINLENRIEEKNTKLNSFITRKSYTEIDNEKLKNMILSYDNEISLIYSDIKNDRGNIDELMAQINDYTSKNQNFKLDYSNNVTNLKKLDKQINVLKKEIQYLEKQVETTKEKVNSKFLNVENIQTKNDSYNIATKKIKSCIFKIEQSTDQNIIDKYFNNILVIVETIYDKFISYEKALLIKQNENLQKSLNESMKIYEHDAKPIINEYLKHIKLLNKNRIKNTLGYIESKNEYIKDSENQKKKINNQIYSISNEISLRRNKRRNDEIAFKNNNYSMIKSFEHDLTSSLLNNKNLIKLKEIELEQFIKKSNSFKKDSIIRAKNQVKQIAYIKNNNLSNLSSITKEKKKQNYIELKKLTESNLKFRKKMAIVEKEIIIDYKNELKKVGVLYDSKFKKWFKEFDKIKNKELKSSNR